ncbi:prepilin-type N-terminal cleavage/methylation domain-containing protein [Acidovorax sp. LjRoot66]|uniref:PulJ/GspJ family protein n=1 Tax=Acidovorax sp. LjRoot66 TaxID=3342334 RepID=UPI003ED1592C
MRSLRSHPLAGTQTGFTLLELMVALAISAVVAVIGASAMSTALDFYGRNNDRARSREEVRGAERILRHEWTTRGIAVKGSATTLEFDTLHPVMGTPGAAPAIARVEYACETAEGGGTMALVHRVKTLAVATTNNRQPAPTLLDTSVLASGLRMCAFSYLTRMPNREGKPIPTWLAKWEQLRQPPDLLRLGLSGVRDDMPALVYSARGEATAP